MGASWACSPCTTARSTEADFVQKRSHDCPVGSRDPFHISKEHADSSMSPATCSTDIQANSSGQEYEEDDEDDEDIDEGAIDEAMGNEAMRDFETTLSEVKHLCEQGQLFDAMAVYKALRQDVLCRSPARRLSGGNRLKAFMASLEEDPMLNRLREVHEHMAELVGELKPSALPGGPSDKRWAHVKCDDPKIHPEFDGKISIRFADSTERDPHGPSTQVIACGVLSNFPLDLDKFVAIYKETDIYRKEWVADCELCEGKTAGPEEMYSAYSRFVNSSPILPVRLEICTVREISVCTKSPIPGRGPGVLIMDNSPPPDVTNYRGFSIPEHQRKVVRLNAVSMQLYFSARPDKPGFTDVFAFAKAGAPIPHWLVPLSLLKRFFAHHFLTLFGSIKNSIADAWETLDYDKRIASLPVFYDAVRRLKEDPTTPGDARSECDSEERKSRGTN